MLHLDTRGKWRRAFSPAWMWTIVVLAATGAGQSEAQNLYPNSAACPTVTNKTLHCNKFDDNKVQTLENFIWGDIDKVIILNATKLEMKDPSCPAEPAKREVEIHNSAKVTTIPGENNCSQQLVLHNSKNVRITDGVDLVRMVNSEADEINLPRVSQFDLHNSLVRKVSVHVDSKMSTIESSEIQVVKKLEIGGPFLFSVEHSTLVEVEGFVYNSSKATTFSNVTLGSVASRGFLVLNGEVKIENSMIVNVEPQALLVMGGSKFVVENTVMHSIAYNSIMVDEGSSVSFKNVTVAHQNEIFFTLSDANRKLFPLALLGEFHTAAPLGWVALYLCVGLAVGCLSGVAIMYFGLRWRGKFKTGADTTELLTREQPTPPSEAAPSVPFDNNKNAPLPPARPLPDVPKPGATTLPENDETYELYADVAPHQPPDVVAQRPPMPVPDERPFTGESTLPMSGQHLATSMPRPNRPNWSGPEESERKDDRDALPPPPSLPDETEEFYDDLESLSAPNNRPMPPPPSQTPKIPPLKKRPPPPTPVRKH